MTPAMRRARLDDANFIAWTILMSQRGHRSRGWFDIALNRPEPECLAFIRSIVAGPAVCVWHVSTFWVAEVDGQPAAALCALPGDTARTTGRGAIKTAMQAMNLNADQQSAIWQRGAYVTRCWTPCDDGHWFIEHVAARPSCRGQGVVQALLAHALREGRAAGFSQASIPFYIGNEAAERCYSRAGFRFASEQCNKAFEALTGAPGFRWVERAC